MRTTLIALALSLAALTTHAQEQWTLERCISHAIDNNIDIKQKLNAQRQQEIALSNAKSARLPEVSANAGQTFNFGRSLTIDNTYSNYSTSQTSFGLGASIPLLTGGRLHHNTELARLNLQAAIADIQATKDELTLNIAAAYLQALFNQELHQVALQQLKLSQQQLQRKRAYREVEKASLSDVAEAEAIVAQNDLTAVTTSSDTQLAMLQLSQLLELPTPETLQLAPLDDDDITAIIERPDALYRQAVDNRAQLQAARLRLQSADRSIRAAKSAYYPQLSFNAGLSTGYYHTKGVSSNSFSKQLGDNLSKYLGFTLTIPLFDRMSTINSVRRARAERDAQQLSLQLTEKALYKDIQQAYYNAVNAQAKYRSSATALQAAQRAFDMVRGKYEQQKANATEYAEQNAKVLQAASEMLRAKYECALRYKIIRFYRGQPMR